MTDWPLEIEGHEFRPIPESWLDHPDATDDDGHGPRCLAVSVAIKGSRFAKVRYVHPVSGNVVRTKCPTAPNPDGVGLVPAGLAEGTGWPRSWVPQPGTAVGVVRAAERDALSDLWRERSKRYGFDYERRALDANPPDADGGATADD